MRVRLREKIHGRIVMKFGGTSVADLDRIRTSRPGEARGEAGHEVPWWCPPWPGDQTAREVVPGPVAAA
jgi:hypothetical protein